MEPETLAPPAGPKPTYTANMPGVKTFAGRLNSMGYNGNNVLAKFNEAAASGDTALISQKVAKMEALAQKVGFQGDLWGMNQQAQPNAVTPGPSAPKPQETNVLQGFKEIGKSLANGLADLPTDFARLGEISTAVGSKVYDKIGTPLPQTQAQFGYLFEKMKGFGDFVAGLTQKAKVGVDESGAYDKGLFSTDKNGDVHWNGIMAGAHSIGGSASFMVSMMGPSVATKFSKAANLLKAAKLAGDVERATELSSAVKKAGMVNSYLGGIVSQIQPLYQDALDATGDAKTASLFTATVAPIVAAVDAFTGVESLITGSGKKALSREVARRLAKELAGDVTEATMTSIAKKTGRLAMDRVKEGIKQTGIEAGTEVGQEGYQIMVEKMFDRAAGNNRMAEHAGAIDSRLYNSAALGGLLGGPMGAILHQSEAYHPTAFKMLQDAYLDGGSDALGLTKAQLNAYRSEFGYDDESGQPTVVDKMASVIQSFKDPYKVDAHTQFQYYDLNYNKLPTEQGELAELQAQHTNLTSEAPVDSEGNAIDPVVAATQAAQLVPQIADQTRRVNYLQNIKNSLTQTGKAQDYGKGFDNIGKFDEGQQVTGISEDNREEVSGTVTGISEDGQTLTVTVPPLEAGEEPVTTTIKASEVKPIEQPQAPQSANPDQNVQEAAEGTIAVAPNLAPGFVSHEATKATPYRDGQRVVLSNDTSVSYPVKTGVDADGNQTLTFTTPQGEITGTVDELTNPASPTRILGTYSPAKALADADFKRNQAKRKAELDKLRKKLPEATITALDNMDEAELRARYEALKGESSGTDERKYIESLEQESRSTLPTGMQITATDASLASSSTADPLAADTPAMVEPTEAGGEIVDDELWNQISDSDVIPAEIITDMAERALRNQEFTERQQLLFDGFNQEDTQVFFDALATITEAHLDQADQDTATSTQTQSPDGANSEGADSGETFIKGNFEYQLAPKGTERNIDEYIKELMARKKVETNPLDQWEINSLLKDARAAKKSGIKTFEDTVTPPKGWGTTEVDGKKYFTRQLPKNEPVSETNNNPDPAGGTQGDAGADSQDGSQGPSKGSTPDVPRPAGSVRPELAEAATTGGTSQSSDAVASGTPETAESINDGLADQIDSSPAVQATIADGEKLVQASLAEQAIKPETVPAAPIYVGPPSLPNPAVGEQIRFTTASGQATLGTVMEETDRGIKVEYTDRKGKPATIYADPYHSAIERKIDGQWKRIETKAPVQRQTDSILEPIGDGEALSSLVGELSRAFPRVKVVLASTQEMIERFGKETIGAVQNGVVYIDQSRATPETPLHEFAHIYTSALSKYSPAVYQRGLDLVRGSEYEARVRATYPDLKTEEAVLEEALAQAISEKGISLGKPSLVQRFLTWAKLALKKISERLSFPLTMESTLDDYVKSRARELLSGNVLSDRTSGDLAIEGVQEQKSSRPRVETVTMPTQMDEAWLMANGEQLTGAQAQALQGSAYQIETDPLTKTDSQVKVDVVAEAKEMGKQADNIDRAGGVMRFLRGHANVLDHANLGRMIFGDSKLGQQYDAMHRRSLDNVAEMKIQGHDAMADFYRELDGKTVFRGSSSFERAEKWDMSGVSAEGKPIDVKVTVDQAMDIGGQFRNTIQTKGHFDPNHTDKTKAGIEPTMGFVLPNAENPDAPIYIRFNKAQLRAIEDRVYNADPFTSRIMQKWATHASSMYNPIARTFTLTTGKILGMIPGYYPLAPASTTKDINAHEITRHVQDAGLLKDRSEGASEWNNANGFLATVNKYQRDSENFVQMAPLAHNLKALAERQRPFFASRGLMPLQEALLRLGNAYQRPDANRNTGVTKLLFNYDTNKLLRLATLSRFAFNIAIPLKQITGYFSAFGSGAIDAKYLAMQAGGYGKNILTAYGLIAKGSSTEGYFGSTTDAAQLQAELRTIGTGDANAILWRMINQTHPDIKFDEWTGARNVAGYLNGQLKSKVRSLFEEYGLSISQRADTAVVGALYKAAKAQVKANNPGFSEQQIRQEAATRAKEALYYSNQTFDQTDRAPIQFAENAFQQMLLLYKGQNVKIFNTMARRAIEVANATGKDKKAARERLALNISLNAVLAPAIITAIDASVAGLRGMSKPEKPEKDDEDESKAYELGMLWLAESLGSLLPAEAGDFAKFAAYVFSNPESPREFMDSNPMGTVADIATSGVSLARALTTKEYKSEEAFQKEITKQAQQAARATSTRLGLPMEITRQLNNIFASIMAPDPNEEATTGDPEAGIEYITGTAENQE